MDHLSQSRFRGLAPAVLGLSLLFLAVSDAGAGCLAAWLCPPAAAEDCAHGTDAPGTWEPAPVACGFEARMENASKKTDLIQLVVLADIPQDPGSPQGHSSTAFEAVSGVRPERSARPALYRLEHALLI